VNLGPGELLVLLVLALLFFGPAKLPSFARSLGHAQREFRRGLIDGAAKLSPPAPGRHGRSDGDGARASDVPRPTSEA
jgi:TatA/E family protein of Tat protein translocase